jgi:transcriptional regulator with XRE-family HTH domain
MKEAATLLGCQAQSVANWETGKRAPAPWFWQKIVQFLGYDPRPREEPLGERLRRHREEQGWSQLEMARRLGVSLSVVGRWEAGRCRPKGGYLAKVTTMLAGEQSAAPASVTVGERLRATRTLQNLSLQAMADRLGVGLATLSRWESGEREPAGKHLARVTDLLGPG